MTFTERLKQKIKSSGRLKRLATFLMRDPYRKQPRWWIKWFVNPWIHRHGRNSRIKRSARLDIFPYNRFYLGKNSVIEDFVTINNGVGEVFIGDRSRIGIGSVIIGPVRIGDDVLLAQNIVLSGMNHGYEDIHSPIRLQATSKNPIIVNNDVWIGANSVLTAGVTIGTHSVIAGGSVVIKDVPPYTVVGGNPARILKRYDTDSSQWIKG